MKSIPSRYFQNWLGLQHMERQNGAKWNKNVSTYSLVKIIRIIMHNTICLYLIFKFKYLCGHNQSTPHDVLRSRDNHIIKIVQGWQLHCIQGFYQTASWIVSNTKLDTTNYKSDHEPIEYIVNYRAESIHFQVPILTCQGTVRQTSGLQ